MKKMRLNAILLVFVLMFGCTLVKCTVDGWTTYEVRASGLWEKLLKRSMKKSCQHKSAYCGDRGTKYKLEFDIWPFMNKLVEEK